MARFVVVTDLFNRADSNDLGADWTPYTGFFAGSIVSNAAEPSSAGENMQEQNTVTILNDKQYAEGTISALDNAVNNWVAVSLRGGTVASGNFYLLVARTPTQAQSNIYRVDAGVLTSLASSTTGHAAGDKYSLEANGTALTSFKNATQDITATDATYTSGKSGIGASKVGIPTGAVAITTWEAGNLTAGGKGGRQGSPGAGGGRPSGAISRRRGTFRRWRG